MEFTTAKILGPVAKLKIGVSSCLLGELVRYDGEHKYNQTVIDFFDDRFEAVLVCPEMEMGMGVPREPIKIVANRLLGVESGKDWTEAMHRFSSEKLKELTRLSGFIFKSRSPSCGVQGVPVYAETEQAEKNSGLFAHAVMKHFPTLPIIDEEALQETTTRKKFIAQVLSYKGVSSAEKV
jgi:uncharacterized protein YbbK (DUF523 family)